MPARVSIRPASAADVDQSELTSFKAKTPQ
jgi:hypothetical protein